MPVLPPPSRFRGLAACCLAVVVATAACDRGDDSADASASVEDQPPPAEAPLRGLPPQALAGELLRLRDVVDPDWKDRSDAFAPLATGDGVTDGSNHGPSDRELFAAEVHRLAGTSPSGTSPSGPLVDRTPTTGPTDREPAQVEALREAALQLDLAAHLLEQQDLTSKSDELRRLAGRLRDEARRLRLGRSDATSLR